MIMFYLVFGLENPNSKKWVQFIYEIEISIYAIILPVIAIMSVETWKNVFTKTFKKLFKSTNVNPSSISENKAIGGIPLEHLDHIKCSNGENIVFKLDQEAKIYFNQLEKAWA
uniref:Uncharacterized protein n=1 Tax=Acrobeloides nanus TaxID=290746 RepID=A0A914C127_9BILA